MPKRGIFKKEEPTELVIERAGEMLGWVGWSFVGSTPGEKEHARLGLMADGDHVDLAGPLLDYALYTIGAKRPNARAIIRLRDYQLELRAALEARGFQEMARNTLHIKHGRLQVVPKRVGKLFELAPTVRALALEPRVEVGSR